MVTVEPSLRRSRRLFRRTRGFTIPVGTLVRPTMYHSFADLITAYLEEHLKGKASYACRLTMAAPWIRTLTATPTREEVLTRHVSKGHGHYQSGSAQANEELSLIRAACHWGIYHNRWEGGDPTLGIKKWKRPRRNHPAKHEEIVQIRDYLLKEPSLTIEPLKHLRDRALFGLMLFTGCRPGEARSVPMTAIRRYGMGGCWEKGKTKNGENQDLPLPSQLMPIIEAWKAVRPVSDNPYLFPGQRLNAPLTEHMVRRRWHELRLIMGLGRLWNYDLRKTLPDVMGNELGYDYATIRAILNHTDHSSTGHYYFKSFNSLVKPMQHYADWLCGLQVERRERRQSATLDKETCT